MRRCEAEYATSLLADGAVVEAVADALRERDVGGDHGGVLRGHGVGADEAAVDLAAHVEQALVPGLRLGDRGAGVGRQRVQVDRDEQACGRRRASRWWPGGWP
nr:hypothetical protein [Angustibacter aerolatus]